MPVMTPMPPRICDSCRFSDNGPYSEPCNACGGAGGNHTFWQRRWDEPKVQRTDPPPCVKRDHKGPLV